MQEGFDRKSRKQEQFRLRENYFATLKETADIVNAFFFTYIEDKFKLTPQLKFDLTERYTQGKTQLRAAQVRFAYELAGGTDWKQIVPACAASTLKEAAYYCIDDIFDKHIDIHRVPLIGIPFISLSYAMISTLDDSFSREEVQEVIHELFRLDELNGQGFILDCKLTTPNEYAYSKKVEGYNFWEQTMRIGAILGHAARSDIDRFGEIGKHIGSAYIIANDTWDFAKDLEDFRAGKYTLPIHYAFEHLTGADKETFVRLFAKTNLSTQEMDAIRTIVVNNDIIAYGRTHARVHCDHAIQLLAVYPDSNAKQMITFATTMTQKNKHYTFLDSYMQTKK